MEEGDEPRRKVVRKRKIAAAVQMGSKSTMTMQGSSASLVAMPSSLRPTDTILSADTDVGICDTLRAILDHQVIGIKRIKNLNNEAVNTIYARLSERACRPEDISSQVTEELNTIVAYRSEFFNASSSRMDGFGWSDLHIQDHMKRFIESKIERMMRCLRSSGESDSVTKKQHVL
jgi:hypothetical protein